MADFSGTALQKAIYAALDGSNELNQLLGPGRIFDDVTDGVKVPYVEFGDTRHENWNSSTDPGTLHTFSLIIWSKARGRGHIFQIAQIIIDQIEQLSSEMDGHSLINIAFEALGISFDPKVKRFRGDLQLRAVTEPVETA